MFKKSFVKEVAKQEGVSAAHLSRQLKLGRAVIPLNKNRELARPVAVGEGCKIKVNTNIGTSTAKVDIDTELKKLAVAVSCRTDTVMDLSIGENLRQIRRRIIAASPVAVGTVPVYEIALEAEERKGSLEKMDFGDIAAVLEQQAQEGVDFFTIHAGILKKALGMIKRKKRTGGIVSRGGAILARWMHINKKENPFYENFDKILKVAKAYNVTLSLGDALRPGAIADSTDDLQIAELNVLGELVKKCRHAGVQVMVEGPGHIKLDEIGFNMQLQKELCDHAPFYVLGPLPVDTAAGYDHITASIGGAFAALYGADFLCVVTPAEHLRHPSAQDIREGVMAARIAGHCVDVLRFKDEWKRNTKLSLFRARRDWENIFPLALDEEKAKQYREKAGDSEDICTMCGQFCSLKIIDECALLK